MTKSESMISQMYKKEIPGRLDYHKTSLKKVLKERCLYNKNLFLSLSSFKNLLNSANEIYTLMPDSMFFKVIQADDV